MNVGVYVVDNGFIYCCWHGYQLQSLTSLFFFKITFLWYFFKRTNLVYLDRAELQPNVHTVNQCGHNMSYE